MISYTITSTKHQLIGLVLVQHLAEQFEEIEEDRLLLQEYTRRKTSTLSQCIATVWIKHPSHYLFLVNILFCIFSLY